MTHAARTIALSCSLIWLLSPARAVADDAAHSAAPVDASSGTHARTHALTPDEDDAMAPVPGTHWRLETRRGVVYVWTPEHYDPATAGLVLYVHGYRSNVDRAWNEHQLARQFAASGVNALFVVPRAPASKRQRVRFKNIGALLGEVRQQTGLERPWGPVVAIGHSGAYRTLSAWLDDPELEHIILLDGLYNHHARFQRWLDDRPGTPHRMTLVSMDTIRESDRFVRDFPDTYVLDWVPERATDIPAQAQSARLLYIHSQFDHMAMVTQARVIPVLLSGAFQNARTEPDADTSREQAQHVKRPENAADEFSSESPGAP